LQIRGLGQVSAGQLRIAVEDQIVIAGDDQLVPEGKRTQPGIEVVYLFDRAPIEIPGMDQDVTRRQLQFAVEAMRVGNADQAKRFLLSSPRIGGLRSVRHAALFPFFVRFANLEVSVSAGFLSAE